jgi:hypothetical protein
MFVSIYKYTSVAILAQAAFGAAGDADTMAGGTRFRKRGKQTGDSTPTAPPPKAIRRVAKQPQVARTHNAYHDERIAGQLAMYHEMCAWLHGDVEGGRDILPFYNYYKRLAGERERVGSTSASEMWSDLSTLRGLDFEFMVTWLGRRSQWGTSTIIALRGKDGNHEDILKLIRYATQLSDKFVLPVALRRKALMAMFLDWLDEQLGSRLKMDSLKEAVTNKGIDWDKLIVYTPTYNENGVVTSLEHVQGDKVDIDPDLGFSTKFEIKEPWSDFGCAFTKGLLTPTPMATWFAPPAVAEDMGPWANTHFNGKNFKLLDREVSRLEKTLNKDIKAASTKCSTPSKDVQELVAEAQETLHNEKGKRLRDSLAEKLLQKRQNTKKVTVNSMSMPRAAG